jgi:hypothetical protein
MSGKRKQYIANVRGAISGFNFKQEACFDRRYHRARQGTPLSDGPVFDPQAVFLDSELMDDATPIWDLGDRFRHPIELHGIKA